MIVHVLASCLDQVPLILKSLHVLASCLPHVVPSHASLIEEVEVRVQRAAKGRRFSVRMSAAAAAAACRGAESAWRAGG